MSRLATLRSRLASLRSARATVRWGSALAGVLLCVFGFWLVAFLVDWSTQLSFASRLVLLLAFVVTVTVAVVRWVLPQFGQAESLEKMALLVERQHGIDSDLVAALEFESPQAATWGSSRLSNAVVDYVAEFSPGLNVFEGFRWRPLPQLATATVFALLLSVMFAIVWPGHASAFWNRFWLGGAHYPTRTQLVEITINGEKVSAFHRQPVELRLPQGEAIRITTTCAGELPTQGTVQVQGRQTRGWNTWTLTPDPVSKGERLIATASALTEDVRLWISAGDATSDPVQLTVMALPILEVQWKVTPPAYAVKPESESIPAGARQFAVLQGSKLSAQVRCLNKSLSKADLVLGNQRVALTSHADADGHTVWELPAGHPLESVKEPLEFTLSVVDQDGLSPMPPWTGQIRLAADRIPRVVAVVQSKKILPTAKPKIVIAALDDFGLKRIRLQATISRAEGESTTDDLVVWQRSPTEVPPLNVKNETTFVLTPYQLSKGDELKVIVLAEDDRGEWVSQVGQSEPLIFEVTDRNGILAGLLETDQQSAKQLDAIIERELGIGGNRR